MSTRSNIIVEQGTTFSANIEIENDEIDLLNFTPVGQFRKSYYSESAINFTAQVVDSKNLVISLTPDQTENLDHGKYVYDIEIQNGTTIYRVIEGDLIITPGVTRNES
jgi:hypothetical protein